jgi:hypothetical protein
VIGATIGDLCEIGNASIFMPGARVGNRWHWTSYRGTECVIKWNPATCAN